MNSFLVKVARNIYKMAHIPTVYETYMSDPYLSLQCKEQLENIQADAVKTITNIERLRNMLYRMNILTRQAGGVFISPTSITRNNTWIECFYLKWDTADKSLYKPTPNVIVTQLKMN